MPVTTSRVFHLFALSTVGVLFSLVYLLASGNACQAVEFKFADNLRIESNENLTGSLGIAGIEMSLLGQRPTGYLADPSEQFFSQNATLPQNIRPGTDFNPEISLFVSGRGANQDERQGFFKQQAISGKHNRYKNTIPAVYRLTLKGYSILEYSDYQTNTWGLNKVKDEFFKKPQIMFSFSKQF